MAHISNPPPPRRGTMAGLALVFAVIVSMAALAFALMALNDARVARQTYEGAALNKHPAAPARLQARPKQFWA